LRGSLASRCAVSIGDTLAVRVAGFYDDTYGFVRNVTLNRDEQREKRWLIRGTVEWSPTETFNASLKLQTGKFRTLGNSFELLDTTSPATLIALGVLDGGTQNYVKYENSQPLGEQIDCPTRDRDRAITTSVPTRS
jgi:hypothetical protein